MVHFDIQSVKLFLKKAFAWWLTIKAFELFAESEDLNPGGVTLNGFQDCRNHRSANSPPQRYKEFYFLKIK